MTTAVLFKVVFGEPLKDAMRKGEGWKIPILIHKATDYIKSKVTVASGIFKAPASKWKVQKLKEEFERGAVGLSKYNDPHSVASLLILYLASLPDPLLSSAQQISIHEAYKTKSDDEFISSLRSTFHKSPLPNKLLVKYLLLFLHFVLSNFSTNKVDANGLATAWAPVLFPPPTPPSLPLSDPPANSEEEIRITEILIENYSPIWENGDTKKAKPTKNSSTNPAPTSPPLSPSLSHAPTLLPNRNGKEVPKRSPSPVPHKRPNSGLSSNSTNTKASPIRASTPSKLTKSPSKKREPTPTKTRASLSPQPPRMRTPTQPRTLTPTKTRVSTPLQPARAQTAPKSTQPSVKAPPVLARAPSPAPPPAPSQVPAPAPARATPPPLPVKRPDPVPEPVPTPRVAQQRTPHETPRNLQHLVDMDLHAEDFGADPHAACAALGVSAQAPYESANERSGNEESGTGGEGEGEDDGFADDEVEGKNTLVWDEERGLVLNNRHSGSFVSIPRLKLELVMPYDFTSGTKAKKPSKGSTKTGKAKLQNTTKPSYKKPPTTASVPAKVNKTLNLPKSENTRTPSPQPKPRPHSSHGPVHTPPRPHSASSPSTPSLHPSSAPQRLKQADEKERDKGEDTKKSDEDRKKMDELLARNKSLEAEVMVLRAKSKEDDEKLANEEKNVSFLLSRVEILDKQRMEAVNKIVDEKSQAEKDLRVRISTLEADVLVLTERIKLTENAADVKAQTLSNQVLQSEARISLLQTQLDKAYEEIADKDERMALLEDEVIKSVQHSGVDLVVLQDSYQIDTPKPPLDSSPFYYHHPHHHPHHPSSASQSMNGHPPRLREQAWKETPAAPN